MKYGCRAHDYGCFTAQELARTLADQGYNAAQLAILYRDTHIEFKLQNGQIV